MMSSAGELSLIMLRGLPGSGKSTLASLLCEGGKYPVHSIDSYFTDKQSGEYHFDHNRNYLAYRQCEDQCRQSMEAAVSRIFIDNTFTLSWEMEPYFKLAAEYHYRIFVLTVENRHGGKNIHGVSSEQLRKMAEKYQVVLIQPDGNV